MSGGSDNRLMGRRLRVFARFFFASVESRQHNLLSQNYCVTYILVLYVHVLNFAPFNTTD